MKAELGAEELVSATRTQKKKNTYERADKYQSHTVFFGGWKCEDRGADRNLNILRLLCRASQLEGPRQVKVHYGRW